jgi:imidazolonepropionase-like amidohydrolase
MKDHHTALDTTMAIFEWLVLARDGYTTPGDAPYLSHMPIGFQRVRQTTIAPKRTAADIERHEASIRKMIATVAMLYKEGILLHPGTDDMTPLTLHRELELYVKAGIPASHVLRIATLDSAQFLGVDQQLGSIERGKLASFFLVSGDPTRDISTVRQIRLVATDGVFYLPAELDEAVGVRPFATPVGLP